MGSDALELVVISILKAIRLIKQKYDVFNI